MLNGCVRKLKSKEGKSIATLPSSDVANTCTTIVLNDDVKKGGRPKETMKVCKLNIDEKNLSLKMKLLSYIMLREMRLVDS